MKKLVKGALMVAGAFLGSASAALAQSSDYNFSFNADDWNNLMAGETAAAGTAFAGLAGFTVVYVVCACLWVIAWIVMVVWVYKDAKKRNLENATLWLILTIFFSWVGLILYLVVGRKGETKGASPVTEKK